MIIFEDEIKKRVLEQVQLKIKAIHRMDIWKIEIFFESVHIFFETDEQVTCHQKDGVCETINNKIADIVRKYDQFGAFKDGIQCIFTSRQTLKEKYAGNMYYYFL